MMPNKNILIVEDDFLNRRLIKKTLLENGYLVFEAKNREQAIKILTQDNIHLAILDINLGENESGIALGEQIQNQFKIPFIYLTAYEESLIVNRALQTQPYSYLTKPLKKTDLITSIEIAIHQFKYEPNLASLSVKDEDYSFHLAIDTIEYIESEGNYLLFHTIAKTYKGRFTVKQILEILSSEHFVQVHRSFIVNKIKIDKHNRKYILIGKKVIPISKNYTENLEFLFS